MDKLCAIYCWVVSILVFCFRWGNHTKCILSRHLCTHARKTISTKQRTVYGNSILTRPRMMPPCALCSDCEANVARECLNFSGTSVPLDYVCCSLWLSTIAIHMVASISRSSVDLLNIYVFIIIKHYWFYIWAANGIGRRIWRYVRLMVWSAK